MPPSAAGDARGGRPASIFPKPVTPTASDCDGHPQAAPMPHAASSAPVIVLQPCRHCRALRERRNCSWGITVGTSRPGPGGRPKSLLRLGLLGSRIPAPWTFTRRDPPPLIRLTIPAASGRAAVSGVDRNGPGPGPCSHRLPIVFTGNGQRASCRGMGPSWRSWAC